jgi:hypothetical protein
MGCMNSLKPTKMAVGVGLLGIFGSLVFSSVLALLPRFYEITSMYMYAPELGRLVMFADWALIAIAIPVISSILSFIFVLKGYDKLNIIVGFIFGGIVLSMGNFLVGIIVRYVTSPHLPENYNLVAIIVVGLVVVCGSALGILLGMFTNEPAKQTLDGQLEL